MIVDSILSAVDGVLGWILENIPFINIDLSKFIECFSWLCDLTKSLNYILPIKEALIFVSILLSVRLAMLIFWLSSRLVNLVRGAG